MWTICLYIYIHLFFYDVIGVVLILIFYEFYLFIFFYIDRSLMHYIVLTYFSKLLRLRFFTTLHFAYLFLMQYILHGKLALLLLYLSIY